MTPLRQDAAGLVRSFGETSQIGRVAKAFIHLLDNPPVPEGYALVKKPELLGKGVPHR